MMTVKLLCLLTDMIGVCVVCLSAFIWVTAPAVASQHTNCSHLSYSSRFTHTREIKRIRRVRLPHMCVCVRLIDVNKVSVKLEIVFHLNLERNLDQWFGNCSPLQSTDNFWFVFIAHLLLYKLITLLTDDSCVYNLHLSGISVEWYISLMFWMMEMRLLLLRESLVLVNCHLAKAKRQWTLRSMWIKTIMLQHAVIVQTVVSNVKLFLERRLWARSYHWAESGDRVSNGLMAAWGKSLKDEEQSILFYVRIELFTHGSWLLVPKAEKSSSYLPKHFTRSFAVWKLSGSILSNVTSPFRCCGSCCKFLCRLHLVPDKEES